MTKKNLPAELKPFSVKESPTGNYLDYLSYHVLTDPDLSGNEVKVFAYLRCHFNRRKRNKDLPNKILYSLQRTQEEMCSDLGLSERGLRNCIQSLEQKEYLYTIRQFKAPSYYVPLDPCESEYLEILHVVNLHRTGGDWKKYNYFDYHNAKRGGNRPKKTFLYADKEPKEINDSPGGRQDKFVPPKQAIEPPAINKPITIDQMTEGLAIELTAPYDINYLFDYDGFIVFDADPISHIPSDLLTQWQEQYRCIFIELSEFDKLMENE